MIHVRKVFNGRVPFKKLLSMCLVIVVKELWTKLILTLSWRRPLSYRNQSMDLQSKSMDWFLYDNGLLYERVKWLSEWHFRKTTITVLKPFSSKCSFLPLVLNKNGKIKTWNTMASSSHSKVSSTQNMGVPFFSCLGYGI